MIGIVRKIMIGIVRKIMIDKIRIKEIEHIHTYIWQARKRVRSGG